MGAGSYYASAGNLGQSIALLGPSYESVGLISIVSSYCFNSQVEAA